MDQHVKVAIGLGANLGDRAASIATAVRRLSEEFLEDVKISRLYESEPFGLIDQPHFLNAVVTGRSVWRPPAMVNYMKRLEGELGRIARIHYGPREIDLDLLLYGDQTFHAEGVTVPHPGIPERDFVMLPLLEVWPEAKFPPAQISIKDLSAELASKQTGPAARVWGAINLSLT